MSEEIISWSSSDYTTEEERTEAMQEFKLKMETFLNEGTCTYEEYQNERVELLEAIKDSFLSDDDKKSVYMVRSKFCPGMSDMDNVSTKYPFSQASDALNYVRENKVNIGENAKEFTWWEITRYDLVNEKYVIQYTLVLDIDCNVLELTYRYDDYDKFNDCQKAALDWYNQFSYGKSKNKKVVKYPYSAGDIIRISNKPFENSYTYYVYTGYGSQTIREGYFDELAGLYHLSFMYHAGEYYHKIYKPEEIDVVESCPSDVLMKISVFLKNNPTFYSSLRLRVDENYDKLSEAVNELAKSL